MTTWKRFSKQLNSKQKPCLNRLKTNATRKRYVGQKEGKITNSTTSVSVKMTTKRHDTLKTKELLSVSAFSNPRSIEAHQISSCVRSFVIFFFHICRFNHRFFRFFVRQFTSSALLRFDSQLQRHFFSQISFKTRIEFGSPGEAICEVARDEQVTCILLGNRGLGAFRRRILGSVSDHVVHHSKIPVIIVPPKGP